MARAIRVNDRTNVTSGIAALGLRNRRQGTVAEQVHDGDTIIVRPIGDVGVRFLGIDTPEISFRMPGNNQFLALSDQRWNRFLDNPFAAGLPPFDPPLDPSLARSLKARLRPGVAANQYAHARAAEQALEVEIQNDLKVMQKTEADFQLYLVFGYEIMDRYGRFLCYINRDQPDRNKPAPRPLSYNERLLAAGRASPYFIWPNLNPWRKKDSILQAVPQPGTLAAEADRDRALRLARTSIREARAAHRGLFDAMDPLILEPFEVRFLSGRNPPSRWVIDLSHDAGVLLPPQAYHRIPNVEDRLFVSPEHVPLFVEHGWKKGK